MSTTFDAFTALSVPIPAWGEGDLDSYDNFTIEAIYYPHSFQDERHLKHIVFKCSEKSTIKDLVDELKSELETDDEISVFYQHWNVARKRLQLNLPCMQYVRSDPLLFVWNEWPGRDDQQICCELVQQVKKYWIVDSENVLCPQLILSIHPDTTLADTHLWVFEYLLPLYAVPKRLIHTWQTYYEMTNSERKAERLLTLYNELGAN